MKKHFLMFILLCTAVIGALAKKTSPETLSGGWTREWSDEFTGSSLNTAVWNVEQVTNPANNELQRYNNDGVSVSDGNLVLTAKRETKKASVANFPSSAAPVPTHAAANVKSLYSDSYDCILNQSTYGFNEQWDGQTTVNKEDFGGNNYLHYSNFNYFGWEFANTDFRDMEYLHVDVCAKTAGSLNIYPIYGGSGLTTDGSHSYTLSGLEAGVWKSFDIPVSAFGALNLSSIFQMKFADGSDDFNEFCVDNVYFYKEAETTEKKFYIAGGFNDWNIDTAIELVKQANGTYTATVNGFRLTNQGFQVVKNNWKGKYGNTGVVPKNMEFDLAKVPSEDVSSNYNIFIGTRGQDVTLNGNVTFTLTLNNAGEPAKLKIDNINYQTTVPADAEGNHDPRDYDSSHNKINLWDTSAPGAIFEINGIKQFDVTPDVNGVYTYTINGVTTKVWDAQFRKNISQMEENSSNVNVSLFDEFFYDITFKIKAEEPENAQNANEGHLSVKIEGSATGDRNTDGGEFIVNEMHGAFEGLELTDDGCYTYRLMNIPGKDVRGAILVVDYSKAAVGTKITIRDVNIWEHKNFHIPALIDGDVYIKDADELQGLAMAIANEEEPAYAKANVYLTADVDTKDITIDSKYIGIGTDTKPFTGTFKSVDVTWDGNGNLEKDDNGNVSRTDAQHSVTLTSTETGVFRFVKDATITGVDVKGSVSPITNDGAGLINKAQGNVTIENCSNAAVVKSEVVSNIGGIIGKFESKDSGTNPGHITIRNVVNRGDITAKEKVGGIIGRVDDSNITLINVLNEATITAKSTSTGSANAAGLVGCQAGDNTDNSDNVDKKTTVIVKNSGNAGDINGKNESAAFFGYMASRNTDTKFTNCYNSGTITGQDDNNNLVRIHADSPLNPTRGDVAYKTKIMDNVYDASAPAGTTTAPTDEQKIQGWVAKNGGVTTPWTMTDVIDGALLNTLNGATVGADVRPWKQTVLADAHPVFDPGVAPTLDYTVDHKTNTTAILIVPAINVDGVPVTIKYKNRYTEYDSEGNVSNQYAYGDVTQVAYTKAGQPTYMPMQRLQPMTEQKVSVQIGNSGAVDVGFTTITHQIAADLDGVAARGEMMKYDIVPIIDYMPGAGTGDWSYVDVENYYADQEKGVYSYTMQNGSPNKLWCAQFRKHLEYTDPETDDKKMVSLREGFVYDLSFTVKVPAGNNTNLTAKLESSETGWRDIDGPTNIDTNDHKLLLEGELSGDGYEYKAVNLRVNKDKDGNDTGHSLIPGAILVIDLYGASAPTDVVISNLHVIEKLDENQTTDIDVHKRDTQLYADKTNVTNNSVTLDLNGYDADDVAADEKIAGKTVIYTITTKVNGETVTWNTTGKAGENTSYVVSGLNKGTDYVFTVTAKLEDDDSPVGSPKNVSATTLDYDFIFNGILYAKNNPNDGRTDNNNHANQVNGTNNKNSDTFDETPKELNGVMQSQTVPFEPGTENYGKIFNEWPYSVGYTVVKDDDGNIVITGGIDSESAQIFRIEKPTIWIDNNDGKEILPLNTTGTANSFSLIIQSDDDVAKNFDLATSRIMYRFAFFDNGFIGTGYERVSTNHSDLTLVANVGETTETTATIYMNGENGTSETVTYTIYRGEFSTPAEAEAAGSDYLVDTTTGSAGHNTNYTFTGLIPDTQYTYTVVVTDGRGQKKSQVVKPRTIPENLNHVEFDNTVDGTAKNVWLNGTNTSYRQEVPYTYSFNLNYNEDGTLTMIGGVGPQGGNTKSVSDAVGIVLPHVYIRKYGDAEFTDVQEPAGKPTEFYCTAPGSYAKGDVVEVKVKYEYNGFNGENHFTTPIMRFVVDNSGEAKTYHYFDENHTTLDGYKGTSKRVRIIRAIKAGHWNTFCVPFNVTKAKLIESMNSTHKNMTLSIHHLDGLTVADTENTYTMKFTENEGDDVTLTAGLPYLVKIAVADDGFKPSKVDEPAADAAITSFDLVDDVNPIKLNTFVPAPAVSKDETDDTKTVSFQASYTALTNPHYVPQGAYIINRSQIRYVDSNVQMLGFRGYFFTDKGINSTSSSDGSDVNKAKVSLFYVFMDDIDDGIITGINIGRDTIDPSQPVFNVSGQRMSGAVKGILIQNGRKFVNK